MTNANETTQSKHDPGCCCLPCVTARKARMAGVFGRLAAAHERFGQREAAESARRAQAKAAR